MKKITVMIPMATLLAAQMVFADSATTLPTQRQNPAAATHPHSVVAYGCMGSGEGEFQGRRSCQGGVVGSCMRDRSDEQSVAPTSPSMPAANPCSSRAGDNSCCPSSSNLSPEK